MGAADNSKQQYWRGHVAEVEKYSGTHEAYCRGEGISSPALKYWRKKIGKENRTGSLAQVQRFIPVEITQERLIKGFPDPRWLAELIIHLSAGAK